MSIPELKGKELKRVKVYTCQLSQLSKNGVGWRVLSATLHQGHPVLEEGQGDCHRSSGFQTLMTSLHPQPVKLLTLFLVCDSETGLIRNSLPVAKRRIFLLFSTVTSSMSAH